MLNNKEEILIINPMYMLINNYSYKNKSSIKLK